MGSGIATAFILSNISVVLKEINNDYLLKGRKMIEGGFFLYRFLFRLTFYGMFMMMNGGNDFVFIHFVYVLIARKVNLDSP